MMELEFSDSDFLLFHEFYDAHFKFMEELWQVEPVRRHKFLPVLETAAVLVPILKGKYTVPKELVERLETLSAKLLQHREYHPDDTAWFVAMNEKINTIKLAILNDKLIHELVRDFSLEV